VAGQINAETALLLGGGRALLMQIAHPSVAAGVADHSGFPSDPYTRLWRTLDATLAVSFGDAAQSRAAAARVGALHRRVQGERNGRRYAAMDPHLLLWVHATLVDGALETYERFVRPLDAEVRERYYQEMKWQALAFEVPADVLPPRLPDFRSYVAATVESLDVGAEAIRLSAEILHPPTPVSLVPASALLRLITVGLLPQRLRSAFGLSWDSRRERLLGASAACIRRIVQSLPSPVRAWPHARTAAARAGADPSRAPRYSGTESRPNE
jgi:uncharacterized protein (DUF2236 family)